MQANIKVLHPADFLRAQAVGEADVAMGERLLSQIAEAAAELDEFEVLIDMRDVTGLLAAADVELLANTMVKHRETFRHKTALLCPRERFENLRFFAHLTARQGLHRVKSFLTYEDAMEWLMSDGDA
jgi:hypothetical protein